MRKPESDSSHVGCLSIKAYFVTTRNSLSVQSEYDKPYAISMRKPTPTNERTMISEGYNLHSASYGRGRARHVSNGGMMNERTGVERRLVVFILMSDAILPDGF